jgi:hypothetical protein
MKNLTETFKNICEKKGIRYRQLDTTTLRTGFTGNNGDFDTYVDIDDEIGQITVRTLSPVRAPLKKWSQAAEIMMLANVKVRYGCFELSFKTGHFAFKTSVMLGNAELHEDIVEHLIYANWTYIDYYSPAINAVLLGNVSPGDALDMLKNQEDSNEETTQTNNILDISKIMGGRLGDILNN